MTQPISKLICPKCKKKGGTLTLRPTGHSKNSLSVYIQHYDPSKKWSRRPCYISRHGIAHIGLTDKRYQSEYKALIKYYHTAERDHLLADDQLNQLAFQAEHMLIEMGWPDYSLAALDKVLADSGEILVEEYALLCEQAGKKKDHDAIAKEHFKEDLKRTLDFTEQKRKYHQRKRLQKKQ